MRHIVRTLAMAAVVVCFAACDEGGTVKRYMPNSHWILRPESNFEEGHRLSLTFSGEKLEVRDANADTPPFEDGMWSSYLEYVDGKGTMNISHTTYDIDDNAYTESYTLDFRMDEELSEMRLDYRVPDGSYKLTYWFDRR